MYIQRLKKYAQSTHRDPPTKPRAVRNIGRFRGLFPFLLSPLFLYHLFVAKRARISCYRRYQQLPSIGLAFANAAANYGSSNINPRGVRFRATSRPAEARFIKAQKRSFKNDRADETPLLKDICLIQMAASGKS